VGTHNHICQAQLLLTVYSMWTGGGAFPSQEAGSLEEAKLTLLPPSYIYSFVTPMFETPRTVQYLPALDLSSSFPMSSATCICPSSLTLSSSSVTDSRPPWDSAKDDSSCSFSSNREDTWDKCDRQWITSTPMLMCWNSSNACR